jgi:hypothetical protein
MWFRKNLRNKERRDSAREELEESKKRAHHANQVVAKLEQIARENHFADIIIQQLLEGNNAPPHH